LTVSSDGFERKKKRPAIRAKTRESQVRMFGCMPKKNLAK